MVEEHKVKKSFVSPDQPQSQEKKEVLSPEVTLMLIYGKVCQAVESLQELVKVFRSVSPQAPTPPVVPVSPVPPSVPMPAIPLPPKPEVKPVPPSQVRLVELKDALSNYEDKVKIEIDTDSMFFIVRPNGFLGNEVFREINNVIRSEPVKGMYVSQSKTSHWKVPKTKPA